MDFKIISKIEDLLDLLNLSSYQLTLIFDDSRELHLVKPTPPVKEMKVGFCNEED